VGVLYFLKFSTKYFFGQNIFKNMLSSRKILCLYLLGCYVSVDLCHAQRISNLRHEQFGEKIIIKYDIVGATSDQTFLINAVCNTGGKSIPLAPDAVENSNWQNVKGGDNRQIVWSVLKQMNELVDEKVSFTIFAEGYSNQQAVAGEPQAPARGMSLSNKKSLVYADLTAQTDTYLEEVYNMVTQFRNFGIHAFESQADLKRLDQQTAKTNAAYDKLLQNRRPFEQTIRELWGSELMNCQTETFFRRSIEQMHRTFLLPLNETVRKINELNARFTSKSERAKTIERLKLEIEIRTSQLDQEINSIKGDAKGLYAQLKQ
jgi:hypothetical protein